MSNRVQEIGFLQAREEERGPLEIQEIPSTAHRVATLLNHVAPHGIPIDLPQGMYHYEKKYDLQYCAHASASRRVPWKNVTTC